MTQHDKSNGFGPDEFSVFMPPRVKRPGPAPRHILFAGVAGACVLGVGLGLWTRPAMSERRAAAAQPADAPKPPVTDRKLEIVVDDHPAPLGAPIEVLSARSVSHPLLAPPTQPMEPAALTPARPPQGLLRVRAVTPPSPSPQAVPTPRPHAAARLAPMAVVAFAPPKSTGAKTKPRAPAAVHLAKAGAAPKPAHKIDLARAAAVKAAAHKVELAKAARQQQIQLAEAEAKGRAEARAEAKAVALAEARDDARKRARLASLAHAFRRLLPHAAKPAPIELAKADHRHAHKTRHELQVERASLKTRRPPHPVEPQARTSAVQIAPQPRSGLMKVSTPRCGSRGAGQALVCVDPSLGAAERQLARAYQGARAAGVPDAQLQRQQQHWLAARSSAAREAPWAVHDVYLARIAELNGQAHEAHGDSY